METLADFGTVSYFARRGLHHRHLQGLVLDGRPRRGGAARCLPARLRGAGAGARAREPRARRVSQRRAAQAGAPPHRLRGGAALLAALVPAPRRCCSASCCRRPARPRPCMEARRLPSARASSRWPATASASPALTAARSPSCSPLLMAYAARLTRQPLSRAANALEPGLRDPGRGDRGRRAGAARPARQCARRLDRARSASTGLLLHRHDRALVYAYLVRFWRSRCRPSTPGSRRSRRAWTTRRARSARGRGRRSRACTCRCWRRACDGGAAGLRRRPEGAAGDASRCGRSTSTRSRSRPTTWRRTSAWPRPPCRRW